MPGEALWMVLDRCGVHPRMLAIVKSFHNGMKADVRRLTF